MALDNALPYGVRDAKLTPYTTGALTTLSTGVDNPNIRTFSFEESEDYEELRGDDKVIAVRGKGASVSWELESGGISIPAYKLMNGGTTVTTGVSPNQITTYTKKVTDERPYFKSEGQAISDNGGDFHAVVYRARASEGINGDLQDGEFWLTGASGTALPALLTGKVDVLYEFVLNETVTPIV